jgi:hypothetical protein
MNDENANEPGPIERLWSRLQVRAIETNLDAAEHLARAARLAALGDRRHWDAWPSRLKEFDLLAGIRESAKFGLWDLEHASGTFLARAVIDAGDYWTLLQLDRRDNGNLLESVHATIEAWAREAEDVDLDDEAADELDEFREAFPVDGNLTLATIESPLGAVERALLSLLPVPPPERIEPIGKPIRIAELQLATPKAPKSWRDNFQARAGRFKVDGEDVVLGGRLSEDWMVSILFEGAPDAISEIEKVRLGGLILEREEGSADPRLATWSAAIDRFDLATRTLLVNQTIGVVMLNGRSLVLP